MAVLKIPSIVFVVQLSARQLLVVNVWLLLIFVHLILYPVMLHCLDQHFYHGQWLPMSGQVQALVVGQHTSIGTLVGLGFTTCIGIQQTTSGMSLIRWDQAIAI